MFCTIHKGLLCKQGAKESRQRGVAAGRVKGCHAFEFDDREGATGQSLAANLEARKAMK